MRRTLYPLLINILVLFFFFSYFIFFRVCCLLKRKNIELYDPKSPRDSCTFKYCLWQRIYEYLLRELYFSHYNFWHMFAQKVVFVHVWCQQTKIKKESFCLSYLLFFLYFHDSSCSTTQPHPVLLRIIQWIF